MVIVDFIYMNSYERETKEISSADCIKVTGSR